MGKTGTESGLDWADYIKPDWLALRREAALEPELPIVDPHHHIWAWLDYGLDEFLVDLGAGHNVRATVHLESGLARNPDDPEHLQAVGETRYLMELRNDPRLQQPAAPDVCAGIVGHIDLDLPEHLFDEAADAHVAAGGGCFKGVRFNAFYHKDVTWLDGTRPGLTENPAIRHNLARLGKRDLVCDVMAFDYQLSDVARMAEALPDVTFIVNHYGGFLGRIAKQNSYDEGMKAWRENITAVSRPENIVMKLGGLTCDFFSGIQLHLLPEPPSSETIERVYRPFFDHCVETFGADRCMFESNYPADREQVDYTILWNGFKRLAAGASADEKSQLFSGTARKVYSLAE